jgi:hypothetical protein
LANALLNGSTFPTWTNFFASIHSTTLALSVTSGGAGEVDVARVDVTASFGNAADGAAANDVAIEFVSCPATTVYTFALNTSSSDGGTLFWQTTLTASKTLGLGDTLRFAIGEVTGTST